jgi:hypothetical protein
MRATRVVLTAPAFDEDLGFLQRIEEFPVQQLIPQLPVKGLDVPILPRTPWLDEERRDGQHAVPSPQGPRDKFWAVVAPNMRRTPSMQKQLTQDFLHFP